MTKPSRKARSNCLVAALKWVTAMLLLATPRTAGAQNAAELEISSPRDGDVLTGVVEIRGTVSTASFLAANLAFAYADVQGEEWFEIAEILQPATNTQLALWDTTAISDGAYNLRLRLSGTDGTVRDAVIRVQIRNYTASPVPTASPTSTAQPVMQVDTPQVIVVTPTVVQLPAETPTPLPPNPAGLTRTQVLTGFARGGFAILAIFMLWGAVTLRRRT